jgi:hypothetical protein
VMNYPLSGVNLYQKLLGLSQHTIVIRGPLSHQGCATDGVL